MRLKTLAAIVSFVSLTLNDGARAQQSERSLDTSPAWNDNSLITVQKRGGNPSFGRRQDRVLWTRCIPQGCRDRLCWHRSSLGARLCKVVCARRTGEKVKNASSGIAEITKRFSISAELLPEANSRSPFVSEHGP